MADTAQLVKDRLSIVDVVGSRIKLEKAGINYKARCPFHSEKTPSFFISPIRNSFYCFGCGAKGDIFEFVSRTEGVDFLGALKILAEKAGVELTFDKKENRDERGKIFSLLEGATMFYEENLAKTPAALEYLRGRGLSEETIKNFRLGFAPAMWRSVSAELLDKGFSEELIEKSGLTKPGNRGYYDRFRGRIMFPIFDSAGRVVAFTGRIFDKSLEGEGVEPAKYVNSPETILYHKSRVLYGFDKAKDTLRKWTYAILVEGQMDLIMSHQAGFPNTVALSGTALTEEQIELISRFTDRILLSLDADAAGISAVGKSATLALSRGFDVKVARLVGGKDPADIIKENSEDWRKIVRGSKHIVEFYLDLIAEKNFDKRTFRKEAAKAVLPFIKIIKSSVDQAHFVSLLAEKLSIPEKAIRDDLERLDSPEDSVKNEERIKEVNSNILSRKDNILQNLVGLAKSGRKDFDDNKLRELTKDFLNQDYLEKLLINDNFSLEATFLNEMKERDVGSPPNYEELLANLELECNKEERERLSQKIKEIEEERDEDLLKEEMAKYQLISKKISEIEERIKQNHFQNN